MCESPVPRKLTSNPTPGVLTHPTASEKRWCNTFVITLSCRQAVVLKKVVIKVQMKGVIREIISRVYVYRETLTQWPVCAGTRDATSMILNNIETRLTSYSIVCTVSRLGEVGRLMSTTPELSQRYRVHIQCLRRIPRYYYFFKIAVLRFNRSTLLALVSAPLIFPTLPSFMLCSYEIEKKKGILLNFRKKETRRKQWANAQENNR